MEMGHVKISFMKRTSEWHILLLFVMLSVILRFFSFFPSVIDHDESTYLEIAREMLEGKLLYVDLIDIKPPGVFLILAGFQAAFGHPIFVMRLLVAVWIGLTAFMIYKSGKLMFNDSRSSLAGGIIYIFFISTWSYYGISITPETFFNLFTILSLYILLKAKGIWKYLFAGLTAGFGFIIKYFVLLDFGVILFFIVFLHNRTDGKSLNLFRAAIALLLAGFGFIFPFLICNLYYLMQGHFEEFVNIIYLSPQRYPSPVNPAKMSIFLLEFMVKYLPVFFFYFYVLFDKKRIIKATDRINLLLVMWSVSSLIAVVISGNHYGHYTIQLMLPVSLLAGTFFHSQRVLPGYLSWLNTKKAGLTTLVLLILIVSMLKVEYFIRRDIPREVAGYVQPLLTPEDIIYTGNYHHIIYYLLRKDSPTPYVHRSILLNQRHLKALDIDQAAEFKKIMRLNPAFIITQKDYLWPMKDYIRDYYMLEKDFGEDIRLYRRIN